MNAPAPLSPKQPMPVEQVGLWIITVSVIVLAGLLGRAWQNGTFDSLLYR